MNNKYFLGIDLGTTNTVAAVGKKESNTNKIKSETILINQKNNIGEPTTDIILPSLLYVGDDFVEPGKFAKAMKEQNYKHVICNIKRFMGTQMVKEVNKRQFRAYEVSAEYLKACRESARDAYLYPFDEVVITVPSSYDPEKRRDTKKAAILAGFKEDKIRLIEEPTAALIDYVYSKSTIDFTDKKRILVYDIGGGTSDISVIDVQIENNEINLEEKAKNRYDDFGGINFDKQCAKYLLEQIIKDHNIDEQKLKKSKKDKIESKLMIFSELVKEIFSNKINSLPEGKNIVIKEKRTIPQLYNSEDIDVSITYEEYIKYIESLLYAPKEKAKTIDDIEESRNIETPILDTLKEYNISLDSIDYVYLTGGMSKFPLIKERIKSILQTKNEIIMAENPFEAVANGAAIYNYYKDKIHEKKLEDSNLQVNDTLNDLIAYSRIQEKTDMDNIGEIKIQKMLPSAVIVNTLIGLPKVIIQKNELYPSESKRILKDVLQTTSTHGIRLEIYSGMDEYDVEMRIQRAYVIEFDKPVPIGTKIDIEYFLDEDAILDIKLIVKDEKEHQFYSLNTVDVATTKIKNNYSMISNLVKRKLFYQLNVPKDNIKSLETIYKNYADNADDSSKIFEVYLKLQNICNNMLDNGINPIESLLYASKICNNMIESEYNQENGFSNLIATIINEIIKKDAELSKKIIEHILERWSWRPQLQIIYNCCAAIKDEELMEKCYLSYEKKCSSSIKDNESIKKYIVSSNRKILDKSILKYVILKSMMLSGFSSMLKNIYKIIADLSQNEDIDRQIYHCFITEIFNYFEKDELKTLYDLLNVKCHYPDYSYNLLKDFNKMYEKEQGKDEDVSKYNKYNQILANLDSPDNSIREEAYRKANTINKNNKSIIDKIYERLVNNKEKEDINIGYAIITIAESLNKNNYLNEKSQKIKEMFNNFEKQNNKGYLLSCYAAKIISGLYEEEKELCYEKLANKIITTTECENKNYIKYIINKIKFYESTNVSLRFNNYLIKYIKNAIDRTNDSEQLKIIIDNYLSLIINGCIKNELDKEILEIRKRKNLQGNTDELHLKILEFINANNSNSEICHKVLFDYCSNSMYSNEVKLQATKYLNKGEIKEGVSCG